MSRDEIVYIQVQKKIRETPKAVLFKLEEGDEQWFPRSVLEDEEPGSVQDGDEIGVRRWFCDKEGVAY